jgi:hypothetical protein
VGAYSDRRAVVLGAATFFLPCGFTQAIQIYALSTGSPAAAAAVLGAFALGTAPGLLAVAGLPMIIPTAWKPSLLRLVGVVVIGFALVNGAAGLRLAGIRLPGAAAGTAPLDEAASDPGGVVLGAAASTPTPAPEPTSVWTAPSDLPVASRSNVPASPDAVATPSVAPSEASPTLTTAPRLTQPAVQEVRTYQDDGGYGPLDAAITAGIPTKWHVDSRSQYGCSAYIVVPSLNLEVALKPGDNVIDLPAQKPGLLEYTCAMGMFYGAITVEPAGAPG